MNLSDLLSVLHCKNIRIINKWNGEETIIEGSNYVDVCCYLSFTVREIQITIADDCTTPLATIYI